MLKKDFSDKQYFYILFRIVKLIKMYIEPESQHLATAKYKHGDPATKAFEYLIPAQAPALKSWLRPYDIGSSYFTKVF